jgi:LPS export ABC transporter protein LptC
VRDFFIKANGYGLSVLVKGIVLISFAIFSLWLLQVSEPPVEVKESPLRHEPDYFAVNFTATIMDAVGKTHYRLQSDYLRRRGLQ